MKDAANHDAGVTVLEAACVQVTLQACEQGVREADHCSRGHRGAYSHRTELEGVGLDPFVRSVPESILSVSVLPFPIPGT